MRKFLSWATLVAGLASIHFAASHAAAQQRPAPQIAVIDLMYIVNQHLRFKQMSADLQRDIEAAENEFRANSAQLQKMAERADGLNRGSPEYKQVEEDVAKRQSELKLQVNLLKRDFAEREAKMWYSVYKEIRDQVQTYAEKHGIVLVIQFNGERADESDPATYKNEIYRAVLYNHPSIDITPIILDAVNPPTRANNNRQTPPQMTTRPQGPSRMGVPPPNKKR